jgi:hypothetical protein
MPAHTTPIRSAVGGVRHPLSPARFENSKAFHTFCASVAPYADKTPAEARRQLDYSRNNVAIQRACIATALRHGDHKGAEGHRRDLDRHLMAVRNGEAYFRALEAKEAGAAPQMAEAA